MRWSRSAMLAVALLIAGFSAANADSPAVKNESPAAAVQNLTDPLLLESRIKPFEEAQPRTEPQEDRLEALTLFATARQHEQREEYDVALRAYQRAWRCDTESLAILREIIALAFGMNRLDQGVRYALKAVELDPSDTVLVRRLAVQATADGDYETALRLYESVLAAEKEGKPNEGYVLIAFQTGKLSCVAGKYDRAAECFDTVIEALDDRDRYGLSDRTAKLLLSDAARTFELFVSSEVASASSEEADAYRLFADALLEADRVDDAQKVFDKVNELSPSAPLHAFDQARIHAKRKEHEQTLSALEPYFAAKTDVWGVAPYELLAEALKGLDREDEILERVKALYAEDPENVALGYYLAQQYYEADDLATAEPLLHELIAQKPLLSGYRPLVAIYRRTNKPGELFDTLSECLDRVRMLEALGSEGKDLLADSETIQALIEEIRRRQQDEPDSLTPAMRRAAAQIALEAGEFEAAQEFYTAAIGAMPNEAANLYLQWGLGLLLREQYAAAVDVFRKAVAASPDEPEGFYYLAGALELAGETDAALEAANRSAELAEAQAEELGDRYYRFLSRAPWILYHAESYDEAQDAYRALIAELDDEYSSSEARDVVRESRMILSNICVMQDQVAEAEELLERVLDEFPSDAGALNDLGYLWCDQGKRLHRSLTMVEQAVAAVPDNPAYRDSLGWALYRLGRYQDAIEQLEKAAAAEVEADGVILDHLGDAYYKLDDVERARETWQKAVESFQKEGGVEHAEKVRAKLDAHEPATSDAGSSKAD